MRPRGLRSRAGGSCFCRISSRRRQSDCLSTALSDSVIRNSGPGVVGIADDKMRMYGAPRVIEQPERRSRGVKIHGFRNPNTVAVYSEDHSSTGAARHAALSTEDTSTKSSKSATTIIHDMLRSRGTSGPDGLLDYDEQLAKAEPAARSVVPR